MLLLLLVAVLLSLLLLLHEVPMDASAGGPLLTAMTTAVKKEVHVEVAFVALRAAVQSLLVSTNACFVLFGVCGVVVVVVVGVAPYSRCATWAGCNLLSGRVARRWTAARARAAQARAERRLAIMLCIPRPLRKTQ